jgi:hypothetical protein
MIHLAVDAEVGDLPERGCIRVGVKVSAESISIYLSNAFI